MNILYIVANGGISSFDIKNCGVDSTKYGIMYMILYKSKGVILCLTEYVWG